MKIVYSTANGINVGEVQRFVGLEAAYAERAVGYVDVEIPKTDYALADFALDGLIEIYRSIEGRNILDAERAYIIRDFVETRDSIRLRAYDGVYLLDGRNVMDSALTSKEKVTGYADDLLKQLVRENLESPTDVDRDVPLFRVSDDISRGYYMTLHNPGQPVALMDMLNYICAVSYAYGTYLTYDVVYSGSGVFTFNTYTGQRGVHRGQTSVSRMIFSTKYGNLANPVYEALYKDERNAVYALGMGAEDSRAMVAQASSGASRSPFSRREMVVNAGQVSSPEELGNVAWATLFENRAIRRIKGDIVQSGNSLYGIDFGFGDLVVVNDLNQLFDAHISAIRLSVNNSQAENVSGVVMGEW